MQSFANSDGARIVDDMIKIIQENKQYLSDVDGAIGDGDHGVNMNKGFTMCAEELDRYPGDLTHSLEVLSKTLMTKIGGAMGPLYGMFFKRMSRKCKEEERINADVFREMLKSALSGVQDIGGAKRGDKTLLDTLIPATEAFEAALENGKDFKVALEEMSSAAEKGKENAKALVARVGRSSRLGERSRGFYDAGAVSCCIILQSMASSFLRLLK